MILRKKEMTFWVIEKRIKILFFICNVIYLAFTVQVLIVRSRLLNSKAT